MTLPGTGAAAGEPAAWREEFPILRQWSYLDCASFGPVPLAHVAASQDLVAQMSELRIADIGGSASMEKLRAEAAALLGCSSDSLALLKCTSEGVDLVVRGLRWRAGDEVILCEDDFPGTIAPWRALERQGVVVRMVPDRGRSRNEVSELEALVTDRTRVICLSLVNSSHGFRAPVAEVAALARSQGIWFVLDAVQAIGSLDLDVGSLGADIVAAHGYKWLLSGFGVALVYCSQRAIEELQSPQIGWKNAIGVAPAEVAVVAGGARRFESTVASIPAVAGMRASIALLRSVGLATVESRVAVLLDALVTAAVAKGYELRSSRAPGETSAIVSLRHPSLDAETVQESLRQARVACAVRSSAVRVAPHFYNSLDDVERFVDALPV